MTESLTILILLLAILAIIFAFFWPRGKFRTDERQSEAIKNLERSFAEMVGVIKEIRGNLDGASQAMHKQIFSFTRETTEMKKQLEQVQSTMQGISSFQEIFRTPKLRGEWGEANLEYILAEVFPRERYQTQYLFSSGEKVDFALKLPNGKLLPIDSKFFSDNFERMIHAQGEEERKFYQKKFVQDIKFNIDKVASKYILPSENTIDTALMYIPAEAIFYNIMFNLKEEAIDEYARKKKVTLASPNTIYLTLAAILHWFRDTQISRQTGEVLRRLSRIQQDSEKLADDFRKLGGHLRNASLSYESSEKRLSLFSDKVEKLLEQEEAKKLE